MQIGQDKEFTTFGAWILLSLFSLLLLKQQAEKSGVASLRRH
jgi:hypothetical protein